MNADSARNKLIAASEHITSLRIVMGFLMVVIFGLWWRNGHLQETQRLFIPPDLTQGAIVQFHEIPTPVVYTFAYYIFQQLHRWKTDGEQDYPAQIYNLQGFFTAACRVALEDDMNHKKRLGELRQRVRTVQEVLGQSYSPRRVVIESAASWRVWLDLTVSESIAGHPVKNVNLRYPLRVVRFDVDKEVNPWGLAIACSEATKPQLLADEALGKPFQPQEVNAP